MRSFAIAFVTLSLVVSCLSLDVAFQSNAKVQEELPPGFSSATELASILANEPDSASTTTEPRFSSLSVGAGAAAGQPDSITFRDDSGTSLTTGTGQTDTSGEDADTAEFDSQIEQINQDYKKLREAIKESQECAARLTEQQAEVRSLEEQRDHLEKEKEKRVLQNKLEKQMKDLSEINRMSRALRTKFSELKHTQKLIKTKMAGTRTSLAQVDNDSDVDETAETSSEDVTAEVKDLQKQQSKVLTRAHATAMSMVRDTVKNAADAQARS